MMNKTIFLLLISTILFGSNLDNFLKNMKEKQAFYQDKNNSVIQRETLIKKYNIPDEKKIAVKHKEFIETMQRKSLIAINKSIPWITDNLVNDVDEKYLQTIADSLDSQREEEKVDTIFYLFSTSQSKFVLYNFIKAASSLEEVNPQIKYYGVIQGLLSPKQLKELYKPFKFRKKLNGKAIIKMQPFIYRDLKLKRVPAYLFSKCPSKTFKYKNCENKYLVKGEISLSEALDIVSKEDSSYLKLLNHLQEEDN